jgi:hypothetical protein
LWGKDKKYLLVSLTANIVYFQNEDTTFITHISLKVSTDVLSGKVTDSRGTENPMSPLLNTPATPL